MDALVFDGRMGAAGDMLLGALVAVGADPAVLSTVEDALGVTYEIDEVTKNGVRATTVDVLVDRAEGGRVDGERDGHERSHHDGSGDHHSHDAPETTDAAHEPGHAGGRPIDHGEPRSQGNPQARNHAEGAGPHRTYPEVVAVVGGMDLPGAVEATALATFERLGEAEASVHGTDLEATHFHEVGADDAIADVVGAALLLDDLDPGRVLTTPLAAGGGEVEMSHGRYPVPTPAVVEIAERADWSILGGPVEAELLTPTGAAILAEVAEGVDALPSIRVRSGGYGAGDRNFPDHPNVLRAIRGELREPTGHPSRASATDGGALRSDEIRVLETNVDDVSPEVLGGLQETLAEAGARDVTIVPTTMKKSRPGHLVKVIAKPSDVAAVARKLAEETGTLGIRETGATHRWIADREVRPVTLDLDGASYEVAVKVASDDAGVVYDVSAEYDDAAAVANETGRPIREVMRLAEAAFRRA